MADTTVIAVPEAEGTKVTWTYDEHATFTSKVMGVFMDMDAMLGPDFEKGLAMLDPLVVAAAAERSAAEAEAARIEAERAAAEAAAMGEGEGTAAAIE